MTKSTARDTEFKVMDAASITLNQLRAMATQGGDWGPSVAKHAADAILGKPTKVRVQ